jgi:hypothetical protein
VADFVVSEEHSVAAHEEVVEEDAGAVAAEHEAVHEEEVAVEAEVFLTEHTVH